MVVIAFSGWARSGKDMLCEYLMKECNAKRFAFADALKRSVSQEFDVPTEWLYDQSLKEKALEQYPVKNTDDFTTKIHDLLCGEFRTTEGEKPYKIKDLDGQTFGNIMTEESCVIYKPVYWTARALCIFKGSGNRSVSPQYWTQNVIKAIKDSNGICVIPDLRFKSEVDQLRQAFGKDVIFIRVLRFKESGSCDASERDLDNYNFDYYINNLEHLGTTKNEAFRQIMTILKEIKND